MAGAPARWSEDAGAHLWRPREGRRPLARLWCRPTATLDRCARCEPARGVDIDGAQAERAAGRLGSKRPGLSRSANASVGGRAGAAPGGGIDLTAPCSRRRGLASTRLRRPAEHQARPPPAHARKRNGSAGCGAPAAGQRIAWGQTGECKAATRPCPCSGVPVAGLSRCDADRSCPRRPQKRDRPPWWPACCRCQPGLPQRAGEAGIRMPRRRRPPAEPQRASITACWPALPGQTVSGIRCRNGRVRGQVVPGRRSGVLNPVSGPQQTRAAGGLFAFCTSFHRRGWCDCRPG